MEGEVVEQGWPVDGLDVPDLLDQPIKPLWQAPNLDKLVIGCKIVSVTGERLVLVQHVASQVLEVFRQTLDQLDLDKAKKDGGEVERQLPDDEEHTDEGLLGRVVTVDEGKMDVHQDLTRKKSCQPDPEHCEGSSFRGRSHSVAVGDKVLADVCEAVDPRPGEGEHDGEEEGGRAGDGEQRHLVKGQKSKVKGLL